MEFIGRNINYDDCMIVALHNAALAVGKKSSYEKLKDVAIKKGWYAPGRAFNCIFLDDAFAYLNLRAHFHVQFETQKIHKEIVKKKKVYFFFRPSEWGNIPGHAMVATKGEVGVKLVNPYHEGCGWKTMSKEIKSGVKHFAIEVMRSA